MKRNLLFTTMALATGSLLAASPKEDVQSAIKKLADAPSYSWSTTTTNLGGGGGGRRGGGGPSQGKAVKDGFALITRAGFQGNTVETVLKGDKSVSKNQDGEWQTPEEQAAAFGGDRGGGRGGGFGGFFRAFNRLPIVDAEELLGAVKEVKLADGAYSGDLSTEAVATRITFGRGRGGGEAPPPPTNTKGTVKFWVKDGVLTKFEFNVQGQTTNFQGDPVDVNRTTTVEIKDIGSTKVEVAEEAKKKIS